MFKYNWCLKKKKKEFPHPWYLIKFLYKKKKEMWCPIAINRRAEFQFQKLPALGTHEGLGERNPPSGTRDSRHSS